MRIHTLLSNTLVHCLGHSDLMPLHYESNQYKPARLLPLGERIYTRNISSADSSFREVRVAYLGYVFVDYVGYNRIYIADINEILASKEQLLLVMLL